MAEKEKKVVEAKEKSAKPAKAKKDKQPGKVKNAWKGFRSELKKIVWPSFSTVVRNTGVVLAMCAVTAVVIIAVDLLCGWLVDLLVSLKL